jgi:two-component system sensor histidine kinase UhpB
MGEIKRVGDSGGRTWSGHYRFRRSDGSYAVVLDRGYIIRDAANKPVRVVGGISDITERRRAEEALESSRRQLRGLSARLQSAREGERTSVAREVHDGLGQILTAIKLNLDWIERRIEDRENDPSFNPMLERIVDSVEMTDKAIETVQRIATDLRPDSLDTLGLADALKQEAERFQKRTEISCELQLPAEPLDLPPEACTAIFRILQEALTNVARHAKAGVTRIALQAGQEKVTLQIEDNGCGIKSDAMVNPRSLGLLGMRERAAVLGGELAIAPITPSGTRVTLNLPRTANDKQFWADL